MTVRVPALLRPVQTPLIWEDGLWIKLEEAQRSGSAKYRLVAAKVGAALERGTLRSGMTLIEATAGSTGVALATLGRAIGAPVELHAYEGISAAKCIRIAEEGARLVLHPLRTPFRRILDLVREKGRSGGYWHLDQYDRSCYATVYREMAEEIYSQVLRTPANPPPRCFVCPVGTGGLLQGLGAHFRAMWPGLQVVAVEPEAGFSIEGMRNTVESCLGEDDPFDPAFPDRREATLRPVAKSNSTWDCLLGGSGRALFEWVRERKMADVLTVAPD